MVGSLARILLNLVDDTLHRLLASAVFNPCVFAKSGPISGFQ